MQLKLRSIAIGMLRFIASGVMAFCIGAAAPLISRTIFAPAYLIPGGLTAMLLLMVLHPLLEAFGYPISGFLEEHGIEGPTFFAMLAVLCGFLFWWGLIFAVWTHFARRSARIVVDEPRR